MSVESMSPIYAAFAEWLPEDDDLIPGALSTNVIRALLEAVTG
jgi:hypothetical protein